MLIHDRRISAIVPCYNRAGHLDRLLESLSWSKVPRDQYEVIVCDDGGADETEQTTGEWCRRGMDVRYHRLREASSPRNNAAARNAGLALARYPIVLNTDSDSVFVSDVLEVMPRILTGDKFCSCGSYRTLTREATRELDVVCRDRPLTKDDYLRRVAGRSNQVRSPDEVHALHGAFVCWRHHLIEIGGYDERFTEWGWEDLDILTRLERGLGLTRRFVEEAAVVHLWHRPLRSDHRRDELAARGEISTRALQIQLQRYRARHLESVGSDDGPCWSIRAHPDDLIFTPAVYGQLRSENANDASALGRRLFQAQVAEAADLRSAGFPDLARRFLLFTSTLPWERALGDDVWQAHVPEVLARGLVRRVEALHPATSEVVALLAECELDLGETGRAERVFERLVTLPAGRPRATLVRARRLVLAGEERGVLAARQMVEGVLRTRGARVADIGQQVRVALAALGGELALLTGDDERAYELAVTVLHDMKGHLDTFDEILFHAYVEHFRRADAGAVPSWLRAGHDRWLAERGEHLYSVAIRATRAGLHHAAVVLLERFLSGGTPTDRRLLTDGGRHLSEARRWCRRTAGPVGVLFAASNDKVPAA